MQLLFLTALLVQYIIIVEATHQYDICKLTVRGTEYQGKISQTQSARNCEYWESSRLDNEIKNHDFPDGSRRTARNFCRNPNNSSFGPWCYTSIETKEKENCTLPTCNSNEDCKITGPGMEYAGNIQKSIYDNECLHWAAAYKTGVIDNMLPEGSVMLAGKSCRNPTGTVEGPWCFVLGGEMSENVSGESWIKEPCDIPTCFNQHIVTVIRNAYKHKLENYYTHYTSTINEEKDEINFSIKLWDPQDWRNGEIKVGISALAVPARGEQLRSWDIGYEIIIRNIRGGITGRDNEEESWEDRAGLLSGVEWVHLKLTWNNGFISLIGKNSDKPYFIHEYKTQEHGILSKQKARIKYISMMGTTAFWNFSQEANQCDEHITTANKITRYWLLSTTSLTKFLTFHVRSVEECFIEFKIAPPEEYPRLKLTMQRGKMNIASIKSAKETKILSSVLDESLSYWKWNEYTISISGYRFSMLLTTKKGVKTIFDVNDLLFQAIKWFGIASTSTAHWTLFCKPLQEEYDATPPECSVSKLDIEYDGHQWVTQKGHPCIPWTANINIFNDKQFSEGSVAAALNYCRNPTEDSQGTYCYAIQSTSDIKISKESCKIRKCRFKDCRIAGTANDFMGELSTTISGRTCQAWTTNTPQVVEQVLLSDDLYPERSIKKANNYCRNPSMNEAGTWCYTLDIKAETDLCNVPDCYKPTACIIIVKTSTRKKLFLVPEWRAHGLPIWMKIWNPNIVTTLVIDFHPLEKSYKYRLMLGADDNESIKLYYISESDSETLLKRKTLSHFLSSGRWVGIKINLMEDGIDIIYEGEREPFFIWKKGANERFPSINAMYFSYAAKSKHDQGSIGLNFQCDICQTEICKKQLSSYSVFYPMNVWMEDVSVPVKSITFHLRGSGVFTVNLNTLPSKYPLGKLVVDDGMRKNILEIQLVRRRYLGQHAVTYLDSPAIHQKYWLEIILTIDEKNGSILLNGTKILEWEYPRIPLFYHFSVQCTEEITWVANCPPPQLDGTPVNGGWSAWSEWQCSVTCGGGRGVRRRKCNEPKASMFGKTCSGPAEEMGTCNENTCGEVSISTISQIRKYLSKQANNIQVNSSEPVALKCNPTLIKLIKEEAPTTSIHWKKNGIKITEDIKVENIDPENFQIVIRTTNSSDNGVYACGITTSELDYEALDMIALTVTNKQYTKIRRIGQKLRILAHSILLNDVYANLRLTWYLNNNIYKEYDITDLRLIDEEIINPINRNHEGVWYCRVYQDQLGLNWNTSWYNLEVKGRANLATYLMEGDLLKGRLGTNELVIYIAVGLLFAIVIGATVAFLIFILRLIKHFNKRSNK